MRLVLAYSSLILVPVFMSCKATKDPSKNANSETSKSTNNLGQQSAGINTNGIADCKITIVDWNQGLEVVDSVSGISIGDGLSGSTSEQTCKANCDLAISRASEILNKQSAQPETFVLCIHDRRVIQNLSPVGS